MTAIEKGIKNDKGSRNQIVFFILGAAILVAIFANLSMNIVINRIIDFAIQNMEVLSDHDAYTVESTIENFHKIMERIAEDIRETEILKEQKIKQILRKRRQLIGGYCNNLLLIAKDGSILDSNLLEMGNHIYEICKEKKGNFACHYKNKNLDGTAWDEAILIGVEINPLILDGHSYIYLVAKMDIDILQNGLKMDSYDNKGHSHVIDFNGYYIISNHRNTEAENVDNFFGTLLLGELKGGITVSHIQKRLNNQENITFQYKDTEGVINVITCTYMDIGGWYFINVVSKEVFEKQSRSLMTLFAFFMLLIFVVIIIIGIIIFQRRIKMLAMERQHRLELTEALDMAQAASRAKTTFLNNMSHDIRTPMNAIIGFVALAITHIDNKERVADYLEKISKSSNHLLSLINDVLDMSRIESGKVNIETKPENLAEILHGLKDIILADVNAKQLELFIDALDVRDEYIICDKLRLNQVLLNLVSNALKYTNPGGMVSIRVIEKGYSETGRGIYEFHVKDNGIGMSPEFAKTIFEPFTREKSSTVSGIQGTGLGMAITKNIVDMMNGTITVNSELNLGTEFIVVFEFAIQEGHETCNTIITLEGLRGLIVDDDINTCQSAASMLRQIGMRPEWCMYGKEAIARTEEALRINDHFHVYIIDWLMPDMNGIETARRIRKIAEQAPIILLSAYDWSDLEEEAREAGITDFISKPLFLSDLRQKLIKVCGEKTEQELVEKEETIDFTGKRLLLVEDIELNREIAMEILTQVGFLVEFAEDGSIAVNIISKAQPKYFDAILMDVQMPIMNGYEATKTIRKLENKELANIPIIAMTANAFEEDKKEALHAGMNAHVSKPIDVPALLETLKEVL